MRYLCLVYHEEEKRDALSEYELVDHREQLRASGNEIVSSPLQPVRHAVTIRVRNGTLAICEGSVVEAREQVGGFYLIEARDLNDAVRIASRMPPARTGCIEVRPLQELPIAVPHQA